MAKVPKNNGKPWSQADISSLRSLAGRNTPIGLIADKLGRSEKSIRSKAINEEISLKPTAQAVNNNLSGYYHQSDPGIIIQSDPPKLSTRLIA